MNTAIKYFFFALRSIKSIGVLAVLFVFLIILPQAVFASTVILTPATGVAGQVVIITGSAFDNTSLTTITWDGVALTTTPTTVTTSGAGAIPASGTVSFIVPSSSYGAHTVQITTGATNLGVGTFTIGTPTVAIGSPAVPLAGLPPGVTLTVSATNLEASKTTTFYFDDTVMGTSTSSVNGTAVLVFEIPDVSNTGAHVIRASNSTYAVASTTMVIAAPAITLSPASSAVGTQVSISGTNFKAGEVVSFFLNGSLLSTDSTVTANGAGSFGATFTIPTSALGTNTIKAQSNTNLYATATLTITTPVLTLSPITGTSGLSTTTGGTGFKANSEVNFFINGSSMDTTATTNSLGSFQVSLKIPQNIPLGAQTVRAQTNSLNFAIATYTSLAASVTALPAVGVPGTRVTLTGSNFDPDSKVTLKWNGDTLTPTETDLRTNSAGSFLANITIPASYSSGNGQIEATTGSTSTVMVAFTIANPTLTLTPSTGIPGAKVSVVGANFEGNQTLQLTWDDSTIVTKPISITTNPLGGFVAIFTVPSSNQGTHFVSATAGSKKINLTSAFTVTAPAVTVSTITSQANTNISIFGTGFSPYKKVTLLWDNFSQLQTDPEEVFADSTGYFSASILIPAKAAPGTHVIQAKTTNEVFDDQTFTVTKGNLSLSRTNGPALGQFQISGTNFDANSDVSFFWDDQKLDISDITTDSIGGFVKTITIPLSFAGTHSIRVSTSEMGTSMADLTVDTPMLSIQPASAAPGFQITLSGTGFVVGKKVVIKVNNTIIPVSPTDLVTDGNGNFVANIKFPFVFGSKVSISAGTGIEDISTISDYPVIHSPLYTTLLSMGKYLITILVLGIIIMIVFNVYKLLKNSRSIIRNTHPKMLSFMKRIKMPLIDKP